MSLGANRFKYGSSCERKKKRRSVPKPVHRTNDVELLIYLAHSGTIAKIFRDPSVGHAIKVLVRLQHMKGRLPYPTVEMMAPYKGVVLHEPKCLCSRNYHHLTPRQRKRAAYHSNGAHNKLLIKIPRHDEWHDAFGLRTLEEIILVLLRFKKSGNVYWNMEYIPVKQPAGRNWSRVSSLRELPQAIAV